MTIRELLFNTAQRRRSDQTLAAVSEALGWPSGHLRAVAEAHGSGDSSTGGPAPAELATLKGKAAAISSRVGAMELLVIEVRDGELLATIEQSARDRGIDSAAIVTLIGAVDSFTLSTMPAGDAARDVITNYGLPAEMTATGEIVNGRPHVHAVMAVEGGRAISGHLHKAQVSTWFVRAYLLAGGSS
jgi:predicted DNA-binding protein with PD1-like motif